MDKDKLKIGAKELADVMRIIKRWARYAAEYDDPEHFTEMLDIHNPGWYIKRLYATGYITTKQVSAFYRLCGRLTKQLYLPKPTVQLYGYPGMEVEIG